MAKFSFIILCFNNWEMSETAITTLLESFDSCHVSKGIELIIVDNGSTDKTQKGIKRIKKKYENVFISIKNVRAEKNMGYTVGINLGLAKCKGEIISVLNNDLVFPVNWFNGLVEILESDNKIGMAAPYLSKCTGQQNVKKTFNSNEEMRAFAAQFMNNPAETIFTKRVIGACMTFKREVLERIGGNDIWFGLGLYDDDDWCNRTIASGYKIAIAGKSFVHHITSATYKQQIKYIMECNRVNKRKYNNKWRYIKKKPSGLTRELLYFPVKMEDFRQPSKDKTKVSSNRSLMVADWTHSHSKWEVKLLSSISKLNPNEEIHLWIPNLYYERLDILKKISKKIEPSFMSKIKVTRQNIPPAELLIFLSSFDKLYSVENDYINKYLISLADSISIQTK